MINQGYKDNFETLKIAAADKNLALLECTEKATGLPTIVLCAVGRSADDGYTFVPLARMFDENPYDILEAPK